jgi:WD40 repeat protein
MVMKRHSYKKNYNNIKKHTSKINGGRPPVEDNFQSRVIANLGRENHGHSDRVKSVAFHPILPLLATGSSDKTAKLWRFSADSSTANFVATLEGDLGHRDEVVSVAFHPKLPLLATGSWDNTAKLWSFNPDGSEDTNMSANCVATLNLMNHGHRARVESVAFHPILPFLATCSYDRTFKLWRFSADGSMATCVATQQYGRGKSVAFHPTEPLLATGSTGGRFETQPKLWSFNPHGLEQDNMSITCVAELWRISRVTSVAFHPMLPFLAIGSDDTTARLWRFGPSGLEIFVTLQTTSDPQNAVTSVVFHPTLPLLATGSIDRTVKLWSFDPDGLGKDNRSAKVVAILTGHRKTVTSVAIHPTLPLLASGSTDTTAKLWRCKMLIIPYNNFTLYCKKGDISEDICNSLCYLCNFNLCMKNSSNDNNSNGYVVKLTNGDLTKDKHVHYNCLHYQLITNKTEIDDIRILSDTIQTILNIDDKMNALIGTDFYK